MTVRRPLLWATIGLVAGGAFATYALVAASHSGRAAAQTTTAAALRSVRIPTVRLKRIANGLSQPLGVTAPSGSTARLFIVEKTGTIRIATNSATGPHAVL